MFLNNRINMNSDHNLRNHGQPPNNIYKQLKCVFSTSRCIQLLKTTSKSCGTLNPFKLTSYLVSDLKWTLAYSLQPDPRRPSVFIELVNVWPVTAHRLSISTALTGDPLLRFSFLQTLYNLPLTLCTNLNLNLKPNPQDCI